MSGAYVIKSTARGRETKQPYDPTNEHHLWAECFYRTIAHNAVAFGVRGTCYQYHPGDEDAAS